MPSRRAGTAVAALVLAAGLSGCGGDPSAGALPTPTQPTSVTSAVADRPPPVRRSARLRCRSPIDRMQGPDRGTQVVRGAVALARRPGRPWSGSRSEDPYHWWTKTPLEIRVQRSAVVEIPAAFADRVAFRWGTDARLAPWTIRLVIPPCRTGWGRRPWIAFPGIISFDAPGCVPVRVTADGRSTVVHMALGRGVPCSSHG